MSLSVYNLLGQEVACLCDEVRPAGEHRLAFDGSGLASGVYLVRLQAADVTQTQKVLLLK